MSSKNEHIRFDVARDFGQTFNSSFRFMKQNFKKFSKSLLFIVGPFLLMSSISYGYMYSGIYSGMFSGSFGSGPSILNSDYMSLQGFIFILSSFVTSIFMSGVIIHFLKLYREKGRDGFDVDDVWRAILKDFWRLTGTFFGLILIAVILIIVIALIITVFAMIPVLGVLFGILAFLGILIIMPPVSQLAFSVYIARCTEDRGLFDAISRSVSIMKGSFWWSWVIVFVSGIIAYFASLIFYIPMMIVMGIMMVHSLQSGGLGDDYSLAMTISISISMFFATLIWGVPMVIMSFHHYSMVEKKDGTGLMERIDDIGKQEEDHVEDGY